MKISIEENKNKILKTLNEVDREGMPKLIDYLQQSDFFSAPCSTMFHLSEKGGLAQHSLNVFEYFKRILSLVDSDLSEDSIILCALLHDTCKINTYKANTNPYRRAYLVDEDLPLGHGEKSIAVIQKFIQLTNVEMLIIRWHMGGFDLSNYSTKSYYSAVDKCAEIVALQSADYLATTFLEAK